MSFQVKHLDSRPGSTYDADRLEHDFKELGFHVDRYLDQTKLQTMKILEEASRYDCSGNKYFVCCILSHGSATGQFWSSDLPIDVDSVLCCFSHSALDGVQKIFILQTCRGEKYEKGVRMESTDGLSTDGLSMDGSFLGERYVDCLVAYATYLGNVAFKTTNPACGSYFINELCWSLENFSGELDLVQILTNVNYHFAHFFERFNKKDDDKRQMTCFTSTMRSKICFGKNIKPYDTEVAQYFDKRKKDSRMTYLCPKSGVLQQCWRPGDKKVHFLSVIIKEGIDASEISYLRRAECSLWNLFASKNYCREELRKCNFRKSEILQFLKLNGNPSGAECIICLVAGYSSNERICDVQGRKFSKRDVISNFIGENSPELVGKPKIFIFLLCERPNKEFESTDGVPNPIKLIPIHADILEVTVTVTGWKQLINPVNVLCGILNHSSSEELVSLLTKINCELIEKYNFFARSNKVSENSSEPKSASFVVTSTLTKALFLP